MKKPHPREVIGNKKMKCEREGTCVPTGSTRYFNSYMRCKTCNRIMEAKKTRQ
jgi:hypothetical protein